MKYSSVSAYFCRLSFCLAMMLGFLQISGFAQFQSGVWERKIEGDVQGKGERTVKPNKFLVYGLNRAVLQRILADAPLEFTAEARAKEIILELPAPDGKLQRFRIEESPMMEPELAAQFPEIKTYHGQGVDDPTATLRFDLTPLGFHSQILSSAGTMLIDPYALDDTENYISYFKRDVPRTENFVCHFGETIDTDFYKSEYDFLSILDAPDVTSGATLRTYRTAVAATGEFTAFYGGTVAQGQAGIVTIMNRVNGVYERDLAIRLTLIGNNSSIVYTNSATDPYDNGDADLLLTQNQANLDAVIGSGNYDIGHVFSTGGGGLAGLGVVCGSRKAQAETGLGSPVGDPFAIDYVAHEMGHQFGGNHTFNASDGNRAASAAYEPGSGITIMAYAGLFGPQDLSNHSIDTFHVKSLEEIITFKTTGNGGTCGTATGTGNTPPTVSAPAGFNIPRNTPFALTATVSDANGDSITYDWEEYDLGAAATGAPNTDADGSPRPIFRPYSPVTSPTRYFPSLTYILNNANVPPTTTTNGFMTGEILPSISRTMVFQVVARDNRSGGGGINTAMTNVVVNAAAGPFTITNLNTSSSITGNSAQTVTWNVAGTTANGINAANVKISLSTDGGQTFPTVLAASTPNDGSESVLIPNAATTQARIKVEAVGNIFFDINDANLTIVNGAPGAFITPGTISITAESCSINAQPDPGETLTVSLPLSNAGNASTTNLTATLQATGGVVSAVSQTYGVVTAGSTVTRNFTFTVNSGLTCGSDVTLTFAVADGATNYSNAARTYSTGVAGAILTQNFDGVTAPALPSGWTNVQISGTAINWVTSATTPSSAPNAAFANERATTNAAALVSPAIAINSSTAQISFRNRFNLEETFDGTVLEFSTNNGANWTDVITGGGSFVSGGYTDTLSTGFDNLLPGRRAWSGNSGGYIDTVVNLPASLNGQSVRFRWLTASDSSAIAPAPNGQWIDNVQIIGKVCQTCIVTAANVSISGRVVLPNDFRLTNALVTLTDSRGVSQTTMTSKFGNFTFREIPAGETYILTVAAKRYTFAPQIISPVENLSGITFTPQ